MRDVFPPRDIVCAIDPKVPYARMDELAELARVTYADANAVRPVFYDGQPLVEVYAHGTARVLTREHVLAQANDDADLALERAHSAELEDAFERWPEDFAC